VNHKVLKQRYNEDRNASMRSRLFNFAVLVSVVLWTSVLVLWVRSYRRCEVLVHQHGPSDRIEVTSEFGLLVLEVEARQQAMIKPDWVYFDKPLPRRWGSTPGLLGFWFYRSAARHYLLLPPTPLWGVTVPHFFLFLLLGALPAVWLARHRQAARVRLRKLRGLCPTCGYNLMANVSGVCPECGTIANQSIALHI
jgi:hypothetical protein